MPHHRQPHSSSCLPIPAAWKVSGIQTTVGRFQRGTTVGRFQRGTTVGKFQRETTVGKLQRDLESKQLLEGEVVPGMPCHILGDLLVVDAASLIRVQCPWLVIVPFNGGLQDLQQLWHVQGLVCSTQQGCKFYRLFFLKILDFFFIFKMHIFFSILKCTIKGRGQAKGRPPRDVSHERPI